MPLRVVELGYWKNTPRATQAMLPQALGTYVVGTLAPANAVLQNTNCSNPQPNNAVGCLAGHLLAAKLNLANGVSACIQATVVAADTLLGTLRYAGPSGSYRLTAAQRDAACSRQGSSATTTGSAASRPSRIPQWRCRISWLIMADPLNRAMLLGDDAIPVAAVLRRHVAEGVRVFLAAYGTRPSSKRQLKGRGAGLGPP